MKSRDKPSSASNGDHHNRAQIPPSRPAHPTKPKQPKGAAVPAVMKFKNKVPIASTQVAESNGTLPLLLTASYFVTNLAGTVLAEAGEADSKLSFLENYFQGLPVTLDALLREMLGLVQAYRSLLNGSAVMPFDSMLQSLRLSIDDRKEQISFKYTPKNGSATDLRADWEKAVADLLLALREATERRIVQDSVQSETHIWMSSVDFLHNLVAVSAGQIIANLDSHDCLQSNITNQFARELLRLCSEVKSYDVSSDLPYEESIAAVKELSIRLERLLQQLRQRLQTSCVRVADGPVSTALQDAEIKLCGVFRKQIACLVSAESIKQAINNCSLTNLRVAIKAAKQVGLEQGMEQAEAALEKLTHENDMLLEMREAVHSRNPELIQKAVAKCRTCARLAQDVEEAEAAMESIQAELDAERVLKCAMSARDLHQLQNAISTATDFPVLADTLRAAQRLLGEIVEEGQLRSQFEAVLESDQLNVDVLAYLVESADRFVDLRVYVERAQNFLRNFDDIYGGLEQAIQERDEQMLQHILGIAKSSRFGSCLSDLINQASQLLFFIQHERTARELIQEAILIKDKGKLLAAIRSANSFPSLADLVHEAESLVKHVSDLCSRLDEAVVTRDKALLSMAIEEASDFGLDVTDAKRTLDDIIALRSLHHIKCRLADDIRIVAVRRDITYSDLKSTLELKFNLKPLRMRWRDNVSDLINIACDEDMKSAFYFMEERSIDPIRLELVLQLDEKTASGNIPSSMLQSQPLRVQPPRSGAFSPQRKHSPSPGMLLDDNRSNQMMPGPAGGFGLRRYRPTGVRQSVQGVGSRKPQTPNLLLEGRAMLN
eukprot:GILJ01005040.1.p1 GENE.GILJ01005040.1~~GILJ01005040.1.p1  ORF type:complete len:833 (+),score=137.93 GILJ01005040.1:95-2593(+)